MKRIVVLYVEFFLEKPMAICQSTQSLLQMRLDLVFVLLLLFLAHKLKLTFSAISARGGDMIEGSRGEEKRCQPPSTVPSTKMM